MSQRDARDRDAEERRVSIEIAWCPACLADRTVEVVTLPGDPGPVAVCVECGLGMEDGWPYPGDDRVADTGPRRYEHARAS